MIIALEGIDASGKNTQAALLQKSAIHHGYSAGCLSFPRYGETRFSTAIAAYLNGELGALDEVSPYLSAPLFAGDRFETREEINSLSAKVDILVLDRYVSSNIAYQAAKIPPEQRAEFVSWISYIEYHAYGLPPADLTVYLRVPVQMSARLLQMKTARSYTSLTADIHEGDRNYLERCAECYEELLASSYMSDWIAVNTTTESGDLYSPDVISQRIWEVAVSRMIG